MDHKPCAPFAISKKVCFHSALMNMNMNMKVGDDDGDVSPVAMFCCDVIPKQNGRFLTRSD